MAGLLRVVGAEQVLLEAEGFDGCGGWLVDQQFMDQMGSPFLGMMGEGVGMPASICNHHVCSPRAVCKERLAASKPCCGAGQGKPRRGNEPDRADLVLTVSPSESGFTGEQHDRKGQGGSFTVCAPGDYRQSVEWENWQSSDC
jgi:hypothetical protein